MCILKGNRGETAKIMEPLQKTGDSLLKGNVYFWGSNTAKSYFTSVLLSRDTKFIRDILTLSFVKRSLWATTWIFTPFDHIKFEQMTRSI